MLTAHGIARVILLFCIVLTSADLLPVRHGRRADGLQQPLFEEEAEFKQGSEHGQHDAAKRLPAIYTQASCQYSTGYLKGYNSTPTPQQTKASAKPPDWSVQYDGEYWYKVWVDRVLVGKATTSEKAERLAQSAGIPDQSG